MYTYKPIMKHHYLCLTHSVVRKSFLLIKHIILVLLFDDTFYSILLLITNILLMYIYILAIDSLGSTFAE